MSGIRPVATIYSPQASEDTFAVRDAETVKTIGVYLLAVMAWALNMLRDKTVENPWKKHDNVPL